MCGRYNLIPDADAFMDAFEITRGIERLPDTPAYNISPSSGGRTTLVPIVRMHDNQRELALVRWPLIPFWAKGRPVSYHTANAKAETLAEKPAYRRAWRRSRCLIPASGYYEWRRWSEHELKQPYHICMTDRSVFAFAGLWETSEPGAGDAVESCTIVTTTPNSRLKDIHPRMPLILPRDGHQDWLDGSMEAAARCIKPFPDAAIQAYPISTYVNNPNHDSPQCIEPIDVLHSKPRNA